MKKNKLTKCLLITLVFVTLIWVLEISKCEFLTMIHGNEFMEFDEISMSSEYKILQYSNNQARIYCINKDHSNGTIHRFINNNGIWKYDNWENGGWSKTGTASGIVWPYWWHSIFIF